MLEETGYRHIKQPKNNGVPNGDRLAGVTT